MKLRIFQSDKGDCTLISQNGKYILVDGGLSGSYTAHVSRHLASLPAIDLLCVSHIDQDHIGGVLKMIDDLVDWRVYDYHSQNGSTVRKPKSSRPPKIKHIWHNAFHEYVSKNVGAIEDMLAANAAILGASNTELDLALAGIATSTAEAIELSRRLKPEQLNIPLNDAFAGKLVMYRQGAQQITLGGLTISVIAPFDIDLRNLRKEWNAWLSDNQDRLKEIRNKVNRDKPYLGTSAPVDYLLALAQEMGDRKKVTTPNLASIMFLLEEGSKKVLMTGDGHSADILKGLRAIGKLNGNSGLHVDVLKVQHHGSDHNIDPEFCKTITANHYIFCGNGAHSNPEISVVDAIIKSRTSAGNNRAVTAEAGHPFTLWFNSSSKATKASYAGHMKKVEDFVKLKASSQVRSKFMPESKSFLDLTI